MPLFSYAAVCFSQQRPQPVLGQNVLHQAAIWLKDVPVLVIIGQTFPLTQPARHLWFRDGINRNHYEGLAVFLLLGTECKDNPNESKAYLVCNPLCGKHVFPSIAQSFVPPALLLFHQCKDGENTCSVPHGADSVTGLITDWIFSFHCPKHSWKTPN